MFIIISNLAIVIKENQNLVSKSDPRLEITVNNETFTTKAVNNAKNLEKNIYTEQFTFRLDQKKDLGQVLFFVKDKDTVRDDLLAAGFYVYANKLQQNVDQIVNIHANNYEKKFYSTISFAIRLSSTGPPPSGQKSGLLSLLNKRLLTHESSHLSKSK